MSCVSDIILVCGVEEQLTLRGELVDVPPPIVGLNRWLKDGEWAPLVRIDEYIGLHSEKGFQALAYGAALNYLDVPAFLQAVADQPWQRPRALLLLLQNEEEQRFTVYRIKWGKLRPQTG